ncbi:MAG: zinc-binding dehydrogenase [Oscillospiraceae bacterium]|nr:zinc-binding dehydrogenase [Oscillospiraceae bacterium]
MPSRCALARQFGIEQTLDCPPQEQVAALKALTGGRGVDIAADATGASPAIANALMSCGKYGQVILLSSPRAPFSGELTPLLSAIHMNMLRVTGAFNSLDPVYETEGSRVCVERNYRVICGLLSRGELDVRALISHVIRPAQVQDAYYGLMYDKENYHCVVIDWTDPV